jgi:hypothetical protein
VREGGDRGGQVGDGGLRSQLFEPGAKGTESSFADGRAAPYVRDRGGGELRAAGELFG